MVEGNEHDYNTAKTARRHGALWGTKAVCMRGVGVDWQGRDRVIQKSDSLVGIKLSAAQPEA